MVTTDKIGLALEEVVREKSLPRATKEAVTDMLTGIREAIDKQDPLAATASIAVYLSRQPVNEQEFVNNAVDTHARKCAVAGGVSGRYAALYPYRWPLVALICVLIMSPYAGPVIGRFLERHIDVAAEKVLDATK